jgi:6-phosphogluconolactonase (cycloisomerase 2 family)
VYIGSGVGTQSSGIAVLSRAASGELLHLGTVAVAGPQATPVGTVTGLAVSPDGRNVYAVRRDDPSLMVFARNPSSGAIYLLQTIFADAAAPYSMSGPVSVAVAPDGTSVYESGSGGVTALARDAATGRLTFVPSGPCICSSAFAVAVSPDGARVYGALSDIESFTRDPSTGAIEELSRTQSVDSCGVSGTTIAVSPDGRLVVAGDERVGGIRVGTPTDKGLGDVRTYPAAAVRRIGGIVWSPDGRFLYVAAESGGSGLYCSNYTPGSAITVFRRDGDNLVQVEARHPVMRSWFPLNPGVTVNAGAQYTNSRDVTLTVTPPWPLASSALVANDGGFASGRMVRTPGPVQIPWRLDEGPAERTVRHVYVRFTPSDARPGLVVGDDVILDTRPPVVSSATSSGGWITVSARDKVSGVASLQLAQRRTAPKRFVRFHKRVRLGHGASPRWARVRDRAGNVSAWEQIRRAPRKRS